MRLSLLGNGLRTEMVKPLTIIEVETGAKLIVVDEGMVEGGMTKVHGGKHPTIGLGSTKMMGSIYTTPEPVWELPTPPISAPPRARTSQTLTSVVKPLKIGHGQRRTFEAIRGRTYF